jgi:hypothetical protein
MDHEPHPIAGIVDHEHLAVERKQFIQGMVPPAHTVTLSQSDNLRCALPWPGHDINDPASTVALMPPLAARVEKPIVGVIDAGKLYDAMAARLMDQGVCIFRNCARATTALVHYVEARLNASQFSEDSR